MPRVSVHAANASPAFHGLDTTYRRSVTSATGSASSSGPPHIEGLSAGMEFNNGLPEQMSGPGETSTVAAGRGRKRPAAPLEPKALRPRRVKAKTSA